MINDNWYTYWMDYSSGHFLYDIYCSQSTYKNPQKAIAESFCPSAMVDNSGDLYTINAGTYPTFWTLSTKTNFLGTARTWLFLVRMVATAHNLGSTNYYASGPITSDHGWDPGWCANGVHNIFSPAIAQEMPGVNSDYLYICFLNPPRRWLPSDNSSSNATEGLCIAKIPKNNLSTAVAIKCVARNVDYDETTGCGYFPFRARSWGHKLQPEWGPCKAFFDGTYIHYFQMANTSLNTGSLDPNLRVTLRYKKINASTFAVVSYSTVDGMFTEHSDNCILFPRFQKVDNTVYFYTSNGGRVHLGRCVGSSAPEMIINSHYQDYIRTKENHTTNARYPSDFCVVKNEKGQHIACFLGLKAGGDETISDLAWARGWDGGIYSSWQPSCLACVLYSYPVPSSKITISAPTNLNTYPSNVIYNTDIQGHANDAVHSNNTTAADIKRLYLNTQNIVAYTSASGHNYIIYAYCYPGKTKQLYLGFAPYTIDAENHVHLGPKCEFCDKNGNSFGNFTDCSRIISMDLKNGHLWITFIRGDSSGWYRFHILAKDLVGE